MEDFLFNNDIKTTSQKTYGTRKVRMVQSLYIIASLFWILLIYLLKLYKTDFFGYLILLIPLFIFAFGFLNATSITGEVEDILYKANYLSVGLIIILPLLTWFANDYKGDPQKRLQFLSIIIVALVLTLFSLMDVWVSRKWYPLVRHLKSVFQTLSISLLIFGLYIYYVERINHESNK
jgi:hypothetical protein